ncbi:uncharacterized protein G2W53_036264 [Senna tora]|uniref:Uncharacterized protein n=1 Tax=Senna tora TaxID=362788 RepID=A0A834SUN5_9FABA|nr:uncharacterized protein G2W53_036264 [Senna tora]
MEQRNYTQEKSWKGQKVIAWHAKERYIAHSIKYEQETGEIIHSDDHQLIANIQDKCCNQH